MRKEEQSVGFFITFLYCVVCCAVCLCCCVFVLLLYGVHTTYSQRQGLQGLGLVYSLNDMSLSLGFTVGPLLGPVVEDLFGDG